MDRKQDRTQVLSGFCSWKNFVSNRVAVGLNIEGERPRLHIGKHQTWYNVAQAIDEPLAKITFDAVMARKAELKCKTIEEAAGLSLDKYLAFVLPLIRLLKKKHKVVLVHLHQYTGSTELNHIIAEHAAVDVIMDKTNFFESPVDYEKQYPEYDAVLSLSQCAGLGVSAGTWIIPTSYYSFDVNSGVVHMHDCTKNYTSEIQPLISQLSFRNPVIYGPLLVVNDLWNPDLNDLDGTGPMLFDDEDMRVLEFVKHNTQIFDSSHNWEHALQVAALATRIHSGSKLTLYLALLHDVCDHKYPKAIPRHVLSAFVKSLGEKYSRVDSWIDRVSFSKQVKTDDNKDIPAELEAVRDADRLEALGKIGIERCIAVVEERKGKIPEDVITHCHEKLLRLLPEYFITSPLGRELALPRHKFIQDWVHAHATTTSAPSSHHLNSSTGESTVSFSLVLFVAGIVCALLYYLLLAN